MGLMIRAFPEREAATPTLASCNAISLLIQAYNVNLYTYIYNVGVPNHQTQLYVHVPSTGKISSEDTLAHNPGWSRRSSLPVAAHVFGAPHMFGSCAPCLPA